MKEEIVKIVYFDGVCGMCDSFVNLLVKIDTNNNLKFSSLQGESGQVLLSNLNTGDFVTGSLFTFSKTLSTSSNASFSP